MLRVVVFAAVASWPGLGCRWMTLIAGGIKRNTILTGEATLVVWPLTRGFSDLVDWWYGERSGPYKETVCSRAGWRKRNRRGRGWEERGVATPQLLWMGMSSQAKCTVP
ncbi:hypothetical protein F4808DRAFT_248432 [Astrocystis sublimbata]|nr:hypothetical protein F4808DRAFT_248432 [Astrocystis sublimbata]